MNDLDKTRYKRLVKAVQDELEKVNFLVYSIPVLHHNIYVRAASHLRSKGYQAHIRQVGTEIKFYSYKSEVVA